MHPARRLWMLAEPFHAIVYFAPQAREAFEAAGLRGFWRGYFAGRAAPLGPVGPGVVAATFFGFHPAFVSRAIPAVWSMATPAEALDARLAGVDAGLGALGIAGGSDARSDACAEAAEHLLGALADCGPGGRPLFAAHAELDPPEEPHLALWHATTLVREHRGDSHVAASVAHDVGPCESHVLRLATDGAGRDTIQPHRGWSDEEWAEATRRLADRGWLDADGVATPAGRQRRDEVEAATDAAAAEVVTHLGDRYDRVVELLSEVVAPIDTAGLLPYPNPIGLPKPGDR